MRKSSFIGAGMVAVALAVAPEAASAGGWWHNRGGSALPPGNDSPQRTNGCFGREGLVRSSPA